MATLYVMSRGVQVGAGQICRVQVEALRSKDLTRVRQQTATTRASGHIVPFPNQARFKPFGRPYPPNRNHADAGYARQRPHRRPQRRHRMVSLSTMKFAITQQNH